MQPMTSFSFFKLLAIVLATGLVVDDGIVVTENIFIVSKRHTYAPLEAPL